MNEIRVCGKEELADGAVRIVEVDKAEIAVIKHAGRHFAYRNLCPHQGGPACEGIRTPRVIDVIDKEGFFRGQDFDESDMHIVCPWHGFEFHLETGEHIGKKNVRLKKYEVLERDGEIYVRL